MSNITRLSAELSALYNDHPHLHHIDPFTLAAIEESGCTFNFDTGEVELPTDGSIPVVGTIDSSTGQITWSQAKDLR